MVVKKHPKDFDVLEDKFKGYMRDQKKLRELWTRLDFNGNNLVSLAEVDKWVIENYPLLNHKPALMLAYKQTSQGQGLHADYIEKKEFKALLGSLVYFNKIFWLFNEVDGDDRRIDFAEFQRCLVIMGTVMSESEAKKQFDEVDANGGGSILFEEFCFWYATLKCPEISKPLAE